MRNYLGIVLFLMTTCIEPYEVVAPDGESLLSVEGHITDGPGPHVIKLTRTATYGSVFVDFTRPVALARVAVRENESGLTFILQETAQGVYETTEEFRARVGNSYSLLITTREGREYRSFPSRMNAVPVIDSVSFETIVIPTEDRLNDRSGLQFVSHFRDPSDQQNFYFWLAKNAVATVETFPEFYKPRFSLPTDPYQPKDCCKYCDLKQVVTTGSLFIQNDELFNGLRTTQLALFIEDDGLRFNHKFKFELHQMGIDAETYQFMRLINQQLALTGSVFDEPPANIRGNIISLDDPEETVLGYFFAAGVSIEEINLEVDDLELLQPPVRINDDCRILIDGVPPRVPTQ
ncbi:MAG: DUF4249 domain-containing protein [Cecembia sp.]